jgi:hypothetical protein
MARRLAHQHLEPPDLRRQHFSIEEYGSPALLWTASRSSIGLLIAGLGIVVVPTDAPYIRSGARAWLAGGAWPALARTGPTAHHGSG